MTREQAFQRLLKLREMTEARGATPAEARVAREKAERLVKRFGLGQQEARQAARARARPPAPRRVHVPEWPPRWSFNAQTQEHSENVRVVSYRNRANWRIEILPEQDDAYERWKLFSGRGR